MDRKPVDTTTAKSAATAKPAPVAAPVAAETPTKTEPAAKTEPKSKPASVKTRKKLSKRKQKKFDKMTRQLALTGTQSKVRRMRQKKEKENAEVVAGAGINTMPASRVSRAMDSPSLPSNVSSAVEKLTAPTPPSKLPGAAHGYKNTRAAREISANKAAKQSQSKRSFEAEQEQTPFKFGSTGIREQRSASFEKKWKNYQRIVESTSKGHLADNEFQQDMKGRRSRNDIYTKPSGHKNTSSGSPFSKRANPKGKSDTYFENINEAEQEVLDSFELQSELNPAAFEGDVMIPEIRERLMEIAQDFLDGIDFKMDVEDITLTGSLANYNWSKYSDFDLHILVDYAAIDADSDLVKRFFQDIKAIWNIRHNIFLKGYEVEVYVQNTNESHMSSGVYSVENDEWVLKPEREETARAPVDKQNIEKKADDIIFQIDRAEKLLADGKLDDALDAIDRLKQKVRNLRKIGLSKEDGVYSVENLAFKTLRRSMELERLSTLKNKAYDRQMSIAQ